MGEVVRERQPTTHGEERKRERQGLGRMRLTGLSQQGRKRRVTPESVEPALAD